MKNKFIKEIIISLILIVLLVLSLNPYNIFMPNMMQMLIICIALVFFSIFTGLILKEKAEDEREEKHRGIAGRAGFLGGASVLIIAIVIETFQHTVDAWLVVALVFMILVKMGFRIYYEKTN